MEPSQLAPRVKEEIISVFLQCSTLCWNFLLMGRQLLHSLTNPVSMYLLNAETLLSIRASKSSCHIKYYDLINIIPSQLLQANHLIYRIWKTNPPDKTRSAERGRWITFFSLRKLWISMQELLLVMEAHVVAIALGDTNDQVVDVADTDEDGGSVAARPEPVVHHNPRLPSGSWKSRFGRFK